MGTLTSSAAQPSVDQTWRPMRRADAAALADLLAAAERVDQADENYDEADVAEEYLNDPVDLDADTRLVWQGTDLIGYSSVFGQRRVRGTHSVWLSGTVHPEHRRRGLGRRLLRWQLDRAGQLHAERHPAASANLMCNASEANFGLPVLARSEGLEEMRSWFEMGRTLDPADTPLPPVPVVPGVRVAPYEAERGDEVRRAHNIAFDGHFGSTERDAQEWRTYFTGSRAFRPELSLVALAEQRSAHEGSAAIAGYLLAYVYEADVAATGRREVYVGQIGTLPDHRGRGVGSALMATGLTNWSAAGHEDAFLGVDTANGTGALGLYERAGFRVHKRSTSWGRRVSAWD